MSPIGRIFSVLNLVLAAAFLAWASNTLATSQQWKAKHDEQVAAREALETELSGTIGTLRAQLTEQAGEANSLNAQLEEARNEAKRVGDDLKLARNENAEFKANLDRLSQSFDSLQSLNRDLIAQKDSANQAREAAEGRADDAERRMQEANSEVELATQTNLQLENTISDLEKQLVAAGKEVSNLETQIASLVDLTGATLGDITAQKRINGAVLKALYDVSPGLVAINVRSQQGVVRGNTFEIYNGNQYKGRVRVENVRPDMSTCLILDTVPGATIQQGDQAATVL
jgi:septal ring factor EnvC (AmiA/AmiB activator)